VAVSHDTDQRTNVASVEDDGPRRSRRQVISFIAAGSFSAFVVGMWLYAFFIYDPGLKVDELADRTFPIAAERICAAGRSDVDALPPANVSRSATERAEVIDSANARLRAMIASPVESTSGSTTGPPTSTTVRPTPTASAPIRRPGSPRP
jgi:hypothetical protein